MPNALSRLKSDNNGDVDAEGELNALYAYYVSLVEISDDLRTQIVEGY